MRDTFIMELPSYRLPKASNVLKEMWERGKAFLLRASTVILAASIVLWFLQSFDYKFTYGVSPEKAYLQKWESFWLPFSSRWGGAAGRRRLPLSRDLRQRKP